MSQKLLLYSSTIISADRDSLGSLDILKKMYASWREILEKQIVNVDDKYRCKFFTKLISHLSSYMSNKILMSHEFNHYIDTGFNLRGIIQNSDFQNSDGHPSPLQVQFIKRLNLQWTHLIVLNSKILEPPFYLKSIRLQLALNLMEEQYNLMCTIAHLYLSLQVTVELCSRNLDANIGSQAVKFIKDFKLEL